MRIEELDTPAALVDLDILDRNLQSMAEYCRQHGLGLRPHSKTHKTPALAQAQMASGAHGITVAKVGEAEVMAGAGLDHLLLAYPVFGQPKWSRVAALARDCDFTMAVDNLATVEGVSAAARQAGSTVKLLVELDVGMRRCGVAGPEPAVALAQQITRMPNVALQGVLFYPGHIWQPAAEQAAALAELSHQVAAVRQAFAQHGLCCEVVSGGSTPSARNSHHVEGLTEIRSGTYIFNDRNTVEVGACQLEECALHVVVTVVSTAVAGRAIVDGGSKTFSSDRLRGSEAGGFGLVREQPDILFQSLSEEHGQLQLGAAGKVRVGDRFTILPNHVCACVNLHEEIWFHRQGEVQGSWFVAGRGKLR